MPQQWFVGTLTLPVVSRTSHGEAQEYITSTYTTYGLKSIPWRGSGVQKMGTVCHTPERVRMDPVTSVTHACLKLGATQGMGGWGTLSLSTKLGEQPHSRRMRRKRREAWSAAWIIT